jgi:hypothetical protein
MPHEDRPWLPTLKRSGPNRYILRYRKGIARLLSLCTQGYPEVRFLETRQRRYGCGD